MSCGDHHDTPCDEVLARVYTYLDGELDQGGCGEVREHLDECGPCLREYGLEEAVKKLVNKSCACESAPGDLRAKVLGRIEQVCSEIRSGDPAREAGNPAGGGIGDAARSSETA
ncbi:MULTISPECIES: mycothiol system anti-sigma-R factor [Thermomonosporaceae]|uniref:mycothiol system anti-sigma-R factor n=1 Tax=Thermomonosporaceae TaxID=2012 RepID=UPI00255B0271|nr:MULTISPECIES: mycothiol system anti-sigma-R factor [Thermomonosporaceae]MDL4771983.1 mycothiol system anti-sigma-R factor [Actinomadura xylanilytica]